jgi:hypothetical protein
MARGQDEEAGQDAPGAEHLEQLLGADLLMGAQLVLHDETRALVRDDAVAGEVDDVIGTAHQAALQVGEAALLGDADDHAALLHEGSQLVEDALLLGLVVEHGLHVAGRGGHEEELEAAGGEHLGRSGRDLPELNGEGGVALKGQGRLGGERSQQLKVPAETGVEEEGLGVRGAQAEDEVQGLAQGAGVVEPALEGALGAIKEGEERLAEITLGGGQGRRGATALGLLQCGALLVDPRERGGLHGPGELARSAAPLNGDSGG